VIADTGDHASILDGCKLSGAKLRPFRHNQTDKLEKMLQRAGGDGGGVLEGAQLTCPGWPNLAGTTVPA